ncbi:MAG: hypothetical protein H0X51_06245 [Parachlamydiaceae bacterium]|nr:hypothetical protein [Parachlamydiaceae bacterium]
MSFPSKIELDTPIKLPTGHTTTRREIQQKSLLYEKQIKSGATPPSSPVPLSETYDKTAFSNQTSPHSKVYILASRCKTLFLCAIAGMLTVASYHMNGHICGLILLGSFMGGKEVHAEFKKRLGDDIERHPLQITAATAVALVVSAKFTLLAVSAVYCCYIGSRFKLLLRYDEPLFNV